MSAESNLNDHADKIAFELSEALKLQHDVDEEIFTVLMHVSPFLGHLIPLQNELGSSYNENAFKQINHARSASKQLTPIRRITDHFENLYVAKVKEEFGDAGSHSNRDSLDEICKFSEVKLNSICSNLEKLQILVGHKQAVDKFHFIISRHIDMLLQQFSLYDQNALSNFPKVTKEYVSLFVNVKVVIRKVIYVLTCSNIYKDKSKILLFIKDVILEKLSIELLTLSTSIRDSLAKTASRPKQKSDGASSKQKIKFLSSIGPDAVHLSVENLSNFAVILHEFLSLEKSLETSDILNILDHKNSKNKKSVLKPHSLELPDLIKTSQHSPFKHSGSRVSKWEWCETLQEFAPVLSSSLVSCLQDKSNTLVQETKNLCKKSSFAQLDTVQCVSKKTITTKKQPKKVLKCVGSVLDLIISWLPFGIIGKKHRFMSKLHSDFLDVVNQVLKETKVFLTDLIEDIPEKASPSLLSMLLATCIDVVIVLQHCEEKLQQDNRLPFNGTIKMYSSTCNHIHQLMVQYHKAQLACTILHDAESNYWSDPRAFAEGERGSYSVEMWQSYLKNLHQECFEFLSYDVSQQIIADVFSDSLSILSNRYCNCNPSYNRQDQVRKDVFEILRFTFIFLWKILSNAHAICPVNYEPPLSLPNSTFDKIHTACNDLLCCINIIGLPLADLHAATTLLDSPKNQLTSFIWLKPFNPGLFPSPWNGKSNDLTDEASVFCILKHFMENPDKKARLALEALTARRCFLFQKLFIAKTYLNDADAKMLENLLNISLFQESLPCNLIIKNDISLFCDFEFLTRENDSRRFMPWQMVIRDQIVTKLRNALLPAVHFMSFHCLSLFSKNLCKKFPPEVLSCIPGVFNEDANEIVHFCAILILQRLRSFALSLSPFVVSLLAGIDHRLHSTSSTVLLFDSFGAHLLLHLTNAFFTQESLLQTLPVSLSLAVTTALHEVARFLLNVESLPANPAEGFETNIEQLLQEINSFRTCTFSLFSCTANEEKNEKRFNPALFDQLLSTNAISAGDLLVITDLSHWITANFSDIIAALDVDVSIFSKGMLCSYKFEICF